MGTVELIAITPNPQQVIEIAARTCYRSGDRIAAETAPKLIRRLLRVGHESPLEHAYATFRLRGFSRAMTHQLVRHRLLAVSQQSQRYVSETAFEYVMPTSVPAEHAADYAADMAAIRDMYAKWKRRGLRNEDARFVLPNACTSELVISANFREFRHIFAVRCAHDAQWEIRACACAMLGELHRQAPAVFDDLVHLLATAPAGVPEDTTPPQS